MKKYILGIIMIVTFSVSTFAQGGKRGNKRMEAQKVAFITNYLDLTPEEAETFWPLYKQFEKEKRTIIKKYQPTKKLVNMSDAELEEQMNLSFQKDQEQLDLKKEYFGKIKKVLSIRKLAMLRVAEKEFKNNILEELQERRKARRERRMNRDN